ncbi:MAG: family peptidase [Candidatus Sumerlaeota bacterium]|nr:family peptidase [Candidatus Sumerlaeota bacterium]
MTAPTTTMRPEILAPAGNEEMVRAAIENGADAIYFGLQDFNARLRAHNFAAADLPRLMAMLHERGVRGYVTLNTLVFCGELADFARTLRVCSDAGVDAILVQDLGAAWLANRLVPQLPLHASTQMTVTCAESVAALERIGLRLERIVAARELSLRDLKKIRAGTDREIEVFVHGALCVAYSGQCLTSEALGGRSANRGECAQACRLPYDLIVDGDLANTEGRKYLLSPKDLAAWEDVGELVDLGIASLKIEGRLKSPEYVAATVRGYREAVDLAAGGEVLRMNEETRRRFEMTFSRGFTAGYLHAVDHQAVVDGLYPKKRGLLIGKVAAVRNGGVLVEATGPVKPGDGVVFDAGRPDLDEQGGRVYTIDCNNDRLEGFDPITDGAKAKLLLSFGSGRIDLTRIHPGDRVWKTSDPALDAEIRATFTGERILHHRPVSALVEGRAGAPLRLTLTDEDGLCVSIDDTEPAEEAHRHPLTPDVLREQLGRLGNTPFELAHLDVRLEGAIMVPRSRLNELRRRAADALVEARRARGTHRTADDSATAALDLALPRRELPPAADSRLSVLCRSLEQVRAAVDFGALDTIYTDFEDIRLHREARALVPANGPRFVPATLRVVKPGEAGFVRKLIGAEPDAVLVRSLAAWLLLRTEAPALPLVGDYPLNVANHLTAQLLMERAGFEFLTPSYDLNIDQLLDLLRLAPPEWFEATIHQRMPLFHMEHCVFCRYLSDGTDYTNCGRPCEKHDVRLRDRMGFDHPLKADAGCRNTVFNAVAQSASAYLRPLLDAGVRRFRVDLLTESAAETHQVLASYLSAVRGERDGSALWRELRASSKLGVTRGSLDHE